MDPDLGRVAGQHGAVALPRYDYRCEACKYVIEEEQGYEVTVVPCPSCGGNAKRVPTYRHQYIRGETVAKGR